MNKGYGLYKNGIVGKFRETLNTMWFRSIIFPWTYKDYVRFTLFISVYIFSTVNKISQKPSKG